MKQGTKFWIMGLLILTIIGLGCLQATGQPTQVLKQPGYDDVSKAKEYMDNVNTPGTTENTNALAECKTKADAACAANPACKAGCTCTANGVSVAAEKGPKIPGSNVSVKVTCSWTGCQFACPPPAPAPVTPVNPKNPNGGGAVNGGGVQGGSGGGAAVVTVSDACSFKGKDITEINTRMANYKTAGTPKTQQQVEKEVCEEKLCTDGATQCKFNGSDESCNCPPAKTSTGSNQNLQSTGQGACVNVEPGQNCNPSGSGVVGTTGTQPAGSTYTPPTGGTQFPSEPTSGSTTGGGIQGGARPSGAQPGGTSSPFG